MSTHKVLDGAAPWDEVLFAKLDGEVQRHHNDGKSADLDPLLALFKDVLQQCFFERLQLAEWAWMDGFLLGFSSALMGSLPRLKSFTHLEISKADSWTRSVDLVS
jgi:hypothetical protein